MIEQLINNENLIEIVKSTNYFPVKDSKCLIRSFGNNLTKILGKLKMCHWYSFDYQTHEIWGDLEQNLSILFDKLQEEIISIYQQFEKRGVDFPIQIPDIVIEDENPENSSIQNFENTLNEILKLVGEPGFRSSIDSHNSNGINNIIEEIMSACNKAYYLTTMVTGIRSDTSVETNINTTISQASLSYHPATQIQQPEYGQTPPPPQ